MKTRIFYFNEDSDGGGQKAKAIGICLSSLANLLFLFFLSFPSTSLWLLYISFFAATDIPKEPKTVAGLAMPIAPSAIPVAPTPMGPSNFLSLVLSSIKAFIIISIPSLCLFLANSCCTSYFFSSLTPNKVAPTSRFEVGSSSTTIPDLASEAAAFFTWFGLPKINDLDPADF